MTYRKASDYVWPAEMTPKTPEQGEALSQLATYQRPRLFLPTDAETGGIPSRNLTVEEAFEIAPGWLQEAIINRFGLYRPSERA